MPPGESATAIGESCTAVLKAEQPGKSPGAWRKQPPGPTIGDSPPGTWACAVAAHPSISASKTQTNRLIFPSVKSATEAQLSHPARVGRKPV